MFFVLIRCVTQFLPIPRRVLLSILNGLISAPVTINSTTSGQYKAFAIFHIGKKEKNLLENNFSNDYDNESLTT